MMMMMMRDFSFIGVIYILVRFLFFHLYDYVIFAEQFKI